MNVSFGYGEAILVSGKVSAGDKNVRNALVRFSDEASNFYRAMTDSMGNYQVYLGPSSVESKEIVPTKFELGQNYPNPFNSTTTIPYEIKKLSQVQAMIYDMRGRKIRQFGVGSQPVGNYKINWDGLDQDGQRVATGIYFCRMQVGNEAKVTKILYDAGGKEVVAGGISPQLSHTSLLKTVTLQGTNYTVTIENTETTEPEILPGQFENIIVSGDTTLDFTVTDLSAVPEAMVYSDSLKQIIRGFGAANIMPWRPDMTDNEIEKAFGTGDGQIGFSMLRLRLPSGGDWDFSIQLSTAKKAHDKGVLVFASPWSPPAEFKSNNNTTGGHLLEEHYQDFADHLNKFIDYMADNGVPLYAVSVQNEPDIEVSYESCDYTPEQMRKFMAENAGTIKTRVIAPESFQFRKNMSDPILNDAEACENLDIVGAHIYGGGLGPYPLAEEKGKEIWMTEHLTGENDTNGSKKWYWAMEAGKEINDCMKYGYSAYVWWYIVRFYGPISDGESNSGRKGDITKKGYVMSQYARFIRPGFHRVETTAMPQRNVMVTSYTNDEGKMVMVAINTANSNKLQRFTFSTGNDYTFTPYTTSESKNCEQGERVTTNNGSIVLSLEASSITTFVSE